MITKLRFYGFLTTLAVALLLSSCSSKSSDVDNQTQEDEATQEQPPEDEVDYKDIFMSQSTVGLYAYSAGVSKYYERSSDQIIYKADMSEYTVTNYSSTILIKATLSGSLEAGESLSVSITSVGISGFSSLSCEMEVVKVNDALTQFHLWSSSEQTGLILSTYD